jgi:hypothetical protein
MTLLDQIRACKRNYGKSWKRLKRPQDRRQEFIDYVKYSWNDKQNAFNREAYKNKPYTYYEKGILSDREPQEPIDLDGEHYGLS